MAIRKPVVPESEVQAAILQYLVMRKILCWRSNSGGMVGEYKGRKRFVQFVRFPNEEGLPDDFKKAMPDIGGVLNDGRALFIECKRRGEKPTQKQLNFLEAVRARLGVAIVAYSVDDVIKAGI